MATLGKRETELLKLMKDHDLPMLGGNVRVFVGDQTTSRLTLGKLRDAGMIKFICFQEGNQRFEITPKGVRYVRQNS